VNGLHARTTYTVRKHKDGLQGLPCLQCSFYKSASHINQLLASPLSTTAPTGKKQYIPFPPTHLPPPKQPTKCKHKISPQHLNTTSNVTQRDTNSFNDKKTKDQHLHIYKIYTAFQTSQRVQTVYQDMRLRYKRLLDRSEGVSFAKKAASTQQTAFDEDKPKNKSVKGNPNLLNATKKRYTKKKWKKAKQRGFKQHSSSPSPPRQHPS
jgi:hypothetical protein